MNKVYLLFILILFVQVSYANKNDSESCQKNQVKLSVFAKNDSDFISIDGFQFYYKKGKLYFDKENIRINKISVFEIFHQNTAGGCDDCKYPKWDRNTTDSALAQCIEVFWKACDPVAFRYNNRDASKNVHGSHCGNDRRNS